VNELTVEQLELIRVWTNTGIEITGEENDGEIHGISICDMIELLTVVTMTGIVHGGPIHRHFLHDLCHRMVALGVGIAIHEEVR